MHASRPAHAAQTRPTVADGTCALRQTASAPDSPGTSPSKSAAPSPNPSPFAVLLTDEQAAACLSVGVRKFHELRAEPWMPPAVVLGPRLLRWPRAELEAAVAGMPRLSASGPEPLHLAKARAARRGSTEMSA